MQVSLPKLHSNGHHFQHPETEASVYDSTFGLPIQASASQQPQSGWPVLQVGLQSVLNSLLRTHLVTRTLSHLILLINQRWTCHTGISQTSDWLVRASGHRRRFTTLMRAMVSGLQQDMHTQNPGTKATNLCVRLQCRLKHGR